MFSVPHDHLFFFHFIILQCTRQEKQWRKVWAIIMPPQSMLPVCMLSQHTVARWWTSPLCRCFLYPTEPEACHPTMVTVEITTVPAQVTLILISDWMAAAESFLLQFSESLGGNYRYKSVNWQYEFHDDINLASNFFFSFDETLFELVLLCSHSGTGLTGASAAWPRRRSRPQWVNGSCIFMSWTGNLAFHLGKFSHVTWYKAAMQHNTTIFIFRLSLDYFLINQLPLFCLVLSIIHRWLSHCFRGVKKNKHSRFCFL